MRNYSSRFQLPNGKWAYIQIDVVAERAKQHVADIRGRWTPPEYFFHHRSGGHVAALHQHRGHAWHAKTDLSNFFANVTRHRIARSLKRIGYSYRDADDFAVASTVLVSRRPRRFGLPYGFVQSPLLASVALDKSALGSRLRNLHQLGVAVSVYVDDIIISGNDEAHVASVLAAIRLAAQNSRFPINEHKSTGPAAALQSFNIDFDVQKMEIANGRYEEMCRKVLMNGAGPVSKGILGYIHSVSPAQAEEMLRAYPDAFPPNADDSPI